MHCNRPSDKNSAIWNVTTSIFSADNSYSSRVSFRDPTSSSARPPSTVRKPRWPKPTHAWFRHARSWHSYGRSLPARSAKWYRTQAGLTRVNDILSKHNVTAPIDGLVTYLPVRMGETVVPGVQRCGGEHHHDHRKPCRSLTSEVESGRGP